MASKSKRIQGGCSSSSEEACGETTALYTWSSLACRNWQAIMFKLWNRLFRFTFITFEQECCVHFYHGIIICGYCTQHSTVQHGTAQHSTAQHSTAQHSTAQHSTAQHSTAQHSTAQHSTAQHSIPHHS